VTLFATGIGVCSKASEAAKSLTVEGRDDVAVDIPSEVRSIFYLRAVRVKNAI
jgi:hypothetical protein